MEVVVKVIFLPIGSFGSHIFQIGLIYGFQPKKDEMGEMYSKPAYSGFYKLHSMRIVVNGQEYQTAARTAAELLQELQAPKVGTAIALDGEVVSRSQLSQTTIPEGSKIEIVRAVQGG